MATASLKGLYESGDGVYWAKSKKTISAAVRLLHKQGYAVRSRKLSRAQGGGHEIRIIGEHRVRAKTKGGKLARPATIGGRGVSYRQGHAPRHIPRGRATGHTPMGGGGGYNGGSSSVASGGYHGSGFSNAGHRIRSGLHKAGQKIIEHQKEQARINKFVEEKKQAAIKQREAEQAKKEQERINQEKAQLQRDLHKQAMERERLEFNRQEEIRNRQAAMERNGSSGPSLKESQTSGIPNRPNQNAEPSIVAQTRGTAQRQSGITTTSQLPEEKYKPPTTQLPESKNPA